MSTGTDPASAGELLEILESAAGLLADLDAAELPTAVLGDSLAGMERLDAVLAAARSGLLAAFDAKDGHLALSPLSSAVPVSPYCAQLSK